VEKGERMTKGTGADSKALQRIANMIAELGDWRGNSCSAAQIVDAAPDVTE
jgi:hypothetical protein